MQATSIHKSTTKFLKVIIDYQIRYKKNISNVIYIFELVKFWGENANFKCDNQGVRYLSEWMSLI